MSELPEWYQQTAAELQEREEQLLRLGLSSAQMLDVVRVAEGDYSHADWSEIRGVSKAAVYNNISDAKEHYSPGAPLSELRARSEYDPNGYEELDGCDKCGAVLPDTAFMHYARITESGQELSGVVCMECAELPALSQLEADAREYGGDVERWVDKTLPRSELRVETLEDAEDPLNDYALLTGELSELRDAAETLISRTEGLQVGQGHAVYWLSDTQLLATFE